MNTSTNSINPNADIKNIIWDFILLTPEDQLLAIKLIEKIVDNGKRVNELSISAKKEAMTR